MNAAAGRPVRIRRCVFVACLALAACAPDAPRPATSADAVAPAVADPAHATADAALSPPLVRAARAQIGVTRHYDPAYVRIPYPGGDVPRDRGVCTDVVVRALRTQGIDLQRAIYEDRVAHPAAYPGRGRAPDRTIDHRRVPNQMTWLARQGWSRPITARAGDYHAGDIVAWRLGNGLLHVGIVTDHTSSAGTPKIVHNIGRGAYEENVLFDFAIIGHYRPVFAAKPERH